MSTCQIERTELWFKLERGRNGSTADYLEFKAAILGDPLKTFPVGASMTKVIEAHLQTKYGDAYEADASRPS